MQSVADDPANQGNTQQSDNRLKSLTHKLHKLANGIVRLLIIIFPISQALFTLVNKKTYFISNKQYDDERISLPTFLQKKFTFQIDINLTSSATRVMFNNRDQIKHGICLKMWLKCHNELYNTGDLTKQTEFLLEGLAFNSQFSRDVYYGIVPVLFDRPDKIKCGPLIENPTLEKLAFNTPYALVMKRLDEAWRLDHQLQLGKLSDASGMEFLAYQVAEMHKKLDRSLMGFGTPECIIDKLDFNIAQFHNALSKRSDHPQIIANSAFSETDIARIESASMLLRQLSEAYQQDFEKRRWGGHIKRCHGDLKAANLWICPADNESQIQERLVALDCVDFNPEFCNIDTLSDVAMLAIDIETRLENSAEKRNETLSGQQLARHFLHTYLRAAGENETIWPLLEYYMIEKAMVCAYMSILYDELPTLGEKYLKVVLAHSQELARLFTPFYEENDYQVAGGCHSGLNHSGCLSE
jgi:aminoglycoside phosphotransferase family enzyme